MSYISNIRQYIGHTPMLSAGATVVVLKDNKILLNLRSDTNTWGIPGGATELGETLEDTAARELKEETNLAANHFKLLTDLFGELLKRNVEIRITDNLWDIADDVQASTLNWSLCRMANAKPRP